MNNSTARTVSVIDLDAFPSITTTTLPAGTNSVGYATTIATTGSPAPQLTVTSGVLPPGLTLDPMTGALTGIPTATGSYTFAVTAASTVSGIPAAATQSYTIAIPAAGTGTAPVLAATGIDSAAWIPTAAALLALGGGLLYVGAVVRRRTKARMSAASL